MNSIAYVLCVRADKRNLDWSKILFLFLRQANILLERNMYKLTNDLEYVN
jgi:hypothetical protein